ncbi:hypothetical protein FZC84_21330 [Rossellomorea vietnamensis]|uniref:Uncharacterized protein n=1 Tax=Rossellomorea vietnamensis TaxID=218284 RepID=A0A5D4M2N3_9BACI|nr:hypothetical protein [Rossellomorea vietnamensis]TYR95737.1 hypothetical protein FZC84_21330 [Rossellomorea vietnamensis]
MSKPQKRPNATIDMLTEGRETQTPDEFNEKLQKVIQEKEEAIKNQEGTQKELEDMKKEVEELKSKKVESMDDVARILRKSTDEKYIQKISKEKMADIYQTHTIRLHKDLKEDLDILCSMMERGFKVTFFEEAVRAQLEGYRDIIDAEKERREIMAELEQEAMKRLGKRKAEKLQQVKNRE